MEKTKKRAKLWLCIGIALMLVSMIAASAIQTSNGKVTIKEMYWETDDGIGICANLYIPANATTETPAPAIVSSHGAYNNKEMQDANSIELSRRGYVVLAVDQASHGRSDLAGTNGTQIPRGAALYNSVQLLSRLPYVDTGKIGVTGHSMGGMFCNAAVDRDNGNETPLIAAVLLNSADATYTLTATSGPVDDNIGDFGNIYGKRDVGIISCVYDEFFHKTADANGDPLSSPYFMPGENAQSFLHFGTDPAGKEVREAGTMYHETIDGKDTVRVIYRPAIIHPWSHFSAQSTRYTIEFFQHALGAPNPLGATDQVWNLKEALNFVGLMGFVLFLVNFTILMVFTPAFSSLRANELVAPRAVGKNGQLWFWGSLAAGALFSVVSFLPLVYRGVSATYVPQVATYGVGLWAAACGLFSILSMVVSYFCYGKKNKMDLAETGAKMPLAKLGKTVLLAVIVITVSYSCVFFADYFFQTDFRIWVLALKAFDANLIYVSIFPYMVLFLLYYVASSVATNCFNYNQIGGKNSWVNTAILAFFAGFPAFFMLPVQYGTYFATNHMMWMQASFSSGGNPPMYVLWLFPMLLILPASVVISRMIYKVTRNPYLSGIITGVIVTLLSCTNTTTNLL